MDLIQPWHDHAQDLPGWFSPQALSLFHAVDEAQRRLDVHGHVGEIGVHCGRSFIPLCLMRRQEEHAVGVDLFEQQGLNRSGSGRKEGRNDREIAERNIHTVCGSMDRVHLLSADSTGLSGSDLRSQAEDQRPKAEGADSLPSAYSLQPSASLFRLWHIDGGHSFHETETDMITCSETLAAGGVLIVDDVFHPGWPEVSRAVYSFLALDTFRPVAIGWRKAVLAARHASTLATAIAAAVQPTRHVRWYDQQVPLYE